MAIRGTLSETRFSVPSYSSTLPKKTKYPAVDCSSRGVCVTERLTAMTALLLDLIQGVCTD